MPKRLLAGALQVCGVLSISAGAALVAPFLGLVVLGVGLAAFGISIERSAS